MPEAQPTRRRHRVPDYRRVHLEGWTYFFTVVTYRRRPLFTNPLAVDLLERCFSETQSVHPFTIDALAVLPDHLHTIWTLPDADADFSTRWKNIKAAFSRGYQDTRPPTVSASMSQRGERGIWQRRFWEHAIRDQEDLNMHRDYIHYNPVKHGLAASASEWTTSTFLRYVERGFYDANWGGTVPKSVAELNFE